jgi:hypothetical protein
VRAVKKKSEAARAIEALAAYFQRNGYVRRINLERREQEGSLYKKGDEVRLVAESRAELAEIRRLLRQAGLKPGRPFAKARQWRQPVYGVSEVVRFLALIEGVGQRATTEPR